MTTQTYAEWSLAFHRRVVADRVPVNGTIEVSRRCSLNCAHCYNNLPVGDAEARRRELSYDEHCRILDEIAEAGCLWLLYTGGEIFARRDFLDIYTYAKKKGLIITLFTNGTLITPRVADYLAEWRPFAVEITLYGRSKETYERLTRVPGSYERCLRGIQLLRERGLPLKLKTVAVTINKHEIGQMKCFAEELGVPFKFDGLINPRIDCSRSPLAVRLRPWEIVQLDLEDTERVAAWRSFAQRTLGPVHPQGREDEVYHCGGGVNAFAIDPDGRMSICVLSQVDTYDLRQGSFREGWEQFLARVRQKKITRPTKCTSCQIKAMCGMCPANGELENGHPEAPVDFLCHVAHLRARALALAVPAHGECEYCEGGVGHRDLLRSAELLRVNNGGRNGAGRGARELLPLLAGAREPVEVGCTSSGCGSCSLAAIHGKA